MQECFDSYFELKRKAAKLTSLYPFINYRILGTSKGLRDIYSLSIGRGEETVILADTLGTPFTANVITDFAWLLAEALNNGKRLFGIDARKGFNGKKITVIPFFNPDNYEHTVKNETEASSKVDLYFNFTKQNNSLGGYAPFSEPETVAIGAFLRKVSPGKLMLLAGGENKILYNKSLYSSRVASVLSATLNYEKRNNLLSGGFTDWYGKSIGNIIELVTDGENKAGLLEALTLFCIC